MTQNEDLIMALVNLDKIQKYSVDTDSALISMVHEIRESLAKKSDIAPSEIEDFTRFIENCVTKD